MTQSASDQNPNMPFLSNEISENFKDVIKKYDKNLWSNPELKIKPKRLVSLKLKGPIESHPTAFESALRRPLRRKLRMRWFFDVSKVKESSFYKSDLTEQPQIFDVHLLENTDLSPSRFNFSVSFYQDHVLSQMILKLIRTNMIEEKKRFYSHKPTFNHIILYKKSTYFLPN